MDHRTSEVASAASGHPGTVLASARLERVARAICEAECMNPDDKLGGWRHWIDAANAAIFAMRAPQKPREILPERKELHQEVMALRGRNFSYGEISDRLGVSRSAIAGICYREKSRPVDR